MSRSAKLGVGPSSCLAVSVLGTSVVEGGSAAASVEAGASPSRPFAPSSVRSGVGPSSAASSAAGRGSPPTPSPPLVASSASSRPSAAVPVAFPSPSPSPSGGGVGGVHSGVNAPVADPGFKKNRPSDSKASNLQSGQGGQAGRAIARQKSPPAARARFRCGRARRPKRTGAWRR